MNIIIRLIALPLPNMHLPGRAGAIAHFNCARKHPNWVTSIARCGQIPATDYLLHCFQSFISLTCEMTGDIITIYNIYQITNPQAFDF